METSAELAYLFDEAWYRGNGPAFEGDAYEHFATAGWREHRDPHPLFDVAYYVERNPDVVAGDENPIAHYLRVGAANGSSPHVLFDPAYYAGTYGEKLHGENPLVHFLRVGGASGFDPNPFFMSGLYLDVSPDVREMGMNPLVHYAMFGGTEWARAPHPLFDAQSYAKRRCLAVGANPLVDFMTRLQAQRMRSSDVHPRPDVSAIVLNLNKSVLTLACVVELLDRTQDLALEVIVVDNGSRPGDFAVLATYMPAGVNVVRLTTNRYFGEGNNIGVEASSGRHVLFVNNDAFVESDTITKLVGVMETFPDAGAAGPRFVYPDGRLQECGAFISSCGTVTQRGKYLDDQHDRFLKTEPVDYVSAACLLVPRALFDRVGGYDLTWDPAYYEDVDLCLKLELLGRRTYYCADAVVTHIENATSSDPSHGLRLNTVVQVNREKFIARWGDYIESRDPADARFVLPPTLDATPSPFTETAVLYTPYALAPGGGERYLLTIAQVLSRRYRTVLVTPERYSSYRLRRIAAELDLDLSRVSLQPLSELPRLFDCELFIAMGNEALPPVPGAGRRRIFVCQFPFPMHPNHLAAAWGTLQTYNDVLVYSDYAARHFDQRARRVARRVPPITVLPPSSPMYADEGPERRVAGRILHVGRFAPDGHCKRQDALVEAFAALIAATGRTDLELHLVGTVSADPAAREYYLNIRRRSAGLPVYFHLNAPPAVVAQLYGSASYYWHATGFGQSERNFPELMEHFGISVVEALSSGTIPLVYAAGGPTEIVWHGVTGMHWRTIDELMREMQDLLARPGEEIEAMRERGRVAARRYEASAFEERLMRFLGAADVTVAPTPIDDPLRPLPV